MLAPGAAAAARLRVVPSDAPRKLTGPMSIVMLIIGLAARRRRGGAVLLGRVRAERALREAEREAHARQLELLEASRGQLRDEMKGISADVLGATAASLARELAAAAPRRRRARRRRDGRAAPPSCAGSSSRCSEKLGKVAEPDRAARARAPRGAGPDGRDAARAQRGALRACAPRPATSSARCGARDARRLGRDPAAQRDRDGGDGRPLRLRRAGDDRRRRRRAACARTCSCGCRAAS